MGKKVEQRICLKFCYLNKIPAADALRMLQKTYGESALSRTRVFGWYNLFKKGRTSLENLPHGRRPATSINDANIEKVKKIVLENHRVTEREIAIQLGISIGSAHTILHEVMDRKSVAERSGFVADKGKLSLNHCLSSIFDLTNNKSSTKNGDTNTNSTDDTCLSANFN